MSSAASKSKTFAAVRSLFEHLEELGGLESSKRLDHLGRCEGSCGTRGVHVGRPVLAA